MEVRSLYPSNESINEIILKSVAKASALSALPIPAVGTIGVALVQVQLIESIAEKYNLSVENKKLTLLTSLISSVASTLITEALIAMTQSTKFDRIFGAALIKASITTITTTAIGELYDTHFRNGGEIDNLNFDVVVSYIKDKLNSDEFSVQNLSNSVVQHLID